MKINMTVYCSTGKEVFFVSESMRTEKSIFCKSNFLCNSKEI